MLTTLALLTLAQALPAKSSAIFTGIPMSSGPSVRLVTHDAKGLLSKSWIGLESTSFLKNTGDKPATVTLTIPVKGQNVDWDMADHFTWPPLSTASRLTWLPEMPR